MGMCVGNGFLPDFITLTSEVNKALVSYLFRFVIAFALMLADLLASPALTRNLSAGSPVPTSQGSLSITQGFCLNSSGENLPVKSDSVGEHI